MKEVEVLSMVKCSATYNIISLKECNECRFCKYADCSSVDCVYDEMVINDKNK